MGLMQWGLVALALAAGALGFSGALDFADGPSGAAQAARVLSALLLATALVLLALVVLGVGRVA